MADNEQPSLWQTIKAAVKAPRGQNAEAVRAVDEEVSKKLPQAVMPRPGIEEDRRRKAMIDALKSE